MESMHHVSNFKKTKKAIEKIKNANILIHVGNFYPEVIGVGKYSAEIAIALAAAGHRVEVVTAPPHYPGWKVERPYKALSYAMERINGVNVWRCPIICKKNGGGIWRILAPLSFALFAAPVVWWRILSSRPDVVVCVEPTLFSVPAALGTARLIGARTVIHVQDLEVDAAFEVHLKSNMLRKVASEVERHLLRDFDHVVTISRRMRQALLQKGVDPKKCTILRNWVDLDAIYPLPRSASNVFRQELGLATEKFVALYAGHLGKKQALDVIIAAARLCRSDERLHFVIAGEGPVKSELVESCMDLTNMTFLPLQPLERFNELLSLADVHLLPQARNTADLVLPSKLGAMLASGRPIIATTDPDTELGDILKGSAILTPPEDANALAAALIEASHADLDEYGVRGRAIAQLLNAKEVLAKFEAVILGEYTGGPEQMDAVLGVARSHA